MPADRGTLFVVATPIGNLEDMTLRALRVLGEVAAVAAEDTRRTGNLLRHYQIATPLISLHEHNEGPRAAQLVKRLLLGDSVALVSDAGTPGISDPGARLVRAARDAGIRVEPIPGASAVTAALSASGVVGDRFAFGGFPPTAAKPRKEWLSWLQSQHHSTVIYFEAPHRIERTLKELRLTLGERPIILARELTKQHEEWLFGTAEQVLAALQVKRGEFVLIIPASAVPHASQEVHSDDVIAQVFWQITESGTESRREAVRLAAERLGLTPRLIYAAVERARNSGI